MNTQIKVAWNFAKLALDWLKGFEDTLDTDFLSEYEKYLICQINYVLQRYNEIETCWDTIQENEIAMFVYIVNQLNSNVGIYLTGINNDSATDH